MYFIYYFAILLPIKLVNCEIYIPPFQILTMLPQELSTQLSRDLRKVVNNWQQSENIIYTKLSGNLASNDAQTNSKIKSTSVSMNNAARNDALNGDMKNDLNKDKNNDINKDTNIDTTDMKSRQNFLVHDLSEHQYNTDQTNSNLNNLHTIDHQSSSNINQNDIDHNIDRNSNNYLTYLDQNFSNIDSFDKSTYSTKSPPLNRLITNKLANKQSSSKLSNPKHSSPFQSKSTISSNKLSINKLSTNNFNSLSSNSFGSKSMNLIPTKNLNTDSVRPLNLNKHQNSIRSSTDQTQTKHYSFRQINQTIESTGSRRNQTNAQSNVIKISKQQNNLNYEVIQNDAQQFNETNSNDYNDHSIDTMNSNHKNAQYKKTAQQILSDLNSDSNNDINSLINKQTNSKLLENNQPQPPMMWTRLRLAKTDLHDSMSIRPAEIPLFSSPLAIGNSLQNVLPTICDHVEIHNPSLILSLLDTERYQAATFISQTAFIPMLSFTREYQINPTSTHVSNCF